jgi:hypothetical protein
MSAVTRGKTSIVYATRVSRNVRAGHERVSFLGQRHLKLWLLAEQGAKA